jgi:hypothetical protein
VAHVCEHLCMGSRVGVHALSRASDAILQFLFDFNLTLGYTYGVRVDKE